MLRLMWSQEFLNLILTEQWARNQHVRSQRPSTRFPTSSFLPSHPGTISTGQDEQTVESSGSHLQGFVCFQKGARCHKPWVFQCYNWFSLSLEYKVLLILFIPPESRHSLLCGICSGLVVVRAKRSCFQYSPSFGLDQCIARSLHLGSYYCSQISDLLPHALKGITIPSSITI